MISFATNEITEITNEIWKTTDETSFATNETTEITNEPSFITDEISTETDKTTEIANEIWKMADEISKGTDETTTKANEPSSTTATTRESPQAGFIREGREREMWGRPKPKIGIRG